MSQFLQRITFPIKNVDIYPCSQKICLCVEYLDFGTREQVNLYKHCMITNLRNKVVPDPPNMFIRYSGGKTWPHPP